MSSMVRTRDGTSLSVRDTGRRDGPALILIDGIGCDGYIWRYVRPAFAEAMRIVHIHHRGHGQSEVPSDLASLCIETLADDVWAVCDALDVDRAVLWGHSMGVQVSLAAAAMAPERVLALLPTCGAFETPLQTFHGSDLAQRVLPWVSRAIKRDDGRIRRAWRSVLPTEAAYWVAVATEVNGWMIRRGDFVPYLEHLAGMEPDIFLLLLERVAAHSARPLLPAISAPALVFAGARDHFTPAALGAELARLLPRGEFCLVPGGSHTAPLELPDLFELRARAFLRQRAILA